jgi:hypothetical protein
VKSVLSDELGPSVAARGPDNIVKRLKVGLENDLLANYANHDVLVLTNGVDVIYEHLEIFTPTDGETANNPIVSSTRSATAKWSSGRIIGTSTQSPTPHGFKAA